MRTPDPFIHEAVERGEYKKIYEYTQGKEGLENILQTIFSSKLSLNHTHRHITPNNIKK